MNPNKGDFAAGALVEHHFTTKVNNVATTLVGGVVRIYKNGNTTELSAGITLTVDFDSKTGKHYIAVDTSQAGYGTGEYQATLTVGSVGGIDIFPEELFSFSINRSLLNIADAILGRNIAGGSSGGRTVSQSLATLRNKQAAVAGVLTTYEQDGTTPMFEANLTTAAGDPITSISPTT